MTYSRWDIWDTGDGNATIRSDTNDDNDDGYPDDEVAVWEKQNVPMKLALNLAGQKSHIGLYGQPVDVYLDGRKV